MKKTLAAVFLSLSLLFISSCKKEENPPTTSMNLSDDYAFCNTQISACNSGSGEFCLFGFKWGLDSTFQDAGFESEGPASSGGLISFSFQEENGYIDTHRQINLPSKSFDEILPCAKTEIRNALNAWAEIADIEFEEFNENSDSQIKFYVADIIQGGIGYPNYPDSLCDELSGNVVIQSGLGISDCNSFYIYALHEVGHVLGLGHVNTSNVMNPSFSDLSLSGLQSGDTLGIVQLYGED